MEKLTTKDTKELKLEIDHIFESGANEIRILQMVKNFIDSRNAETNVSKITTKYTEEDMLKAFEKGALYGTTKNGNTHYFNEVINSIKNNELLIG